jgi:D-alanyl-D-alanine carboxypeptidase
MKVPATYLSRSAIISTLMIAVAPCIRTQVTIDEAQFLRIRAAFQTKLDQEIARAKVPGGTVSFVLPDGRRASFAAGVRSRESKEPMQPNDPMFAGSIGKTFVAAVTLQLVGEGKLNLDEKISRWLGDKSWFPKLPNSPDITLRMLLNHSSGIPNHVEEKSFFKASLKDAGRDIKYEELLNFILDKRPLFPAGTGYSYADTNYIIVGLIVEKATGNTLYDEVSRRLLKPLELNNTYPTNMNVVPIVAGYYKNEPMIKNGRVLVNPQWEWAGGGFGSTTGDLALWATKLYSGSVLKKELFAQMISSTSSGEGQSYGLGVEVLHARWGTTLGHDGEFPGYLSDMRYYRDYGFAIAIQVNADDAYTLNAFSSALDGFAQIIIEEVSKNKLSPSEVSELRRFCEAWLALVNAGKYSESWDSLSSDLKAKYTRQSWPDALTPFLKKVGGLNRREFKSAASPRPEEAVVDFESSFSKLKSGTESVFLKRENDGKWHVSSYSIHGSGDEK